MLYIFYDANLCVNNITKLRYYTYLFINKIKTTRSAIKMLKIKRDTLNRKNITVNEVIKINVKVEK